MVVGSVFFNREHSRKPDEAYALIESCSPGPYLELFARGSRDGWISWGNEAGECPTRVANVHQLVAGGRRLSVGWLMPICLLRWSFQLADGRTCFRYTYASLRRFRIVCGV
jgi:hypothetical protein